VPLSVNPGFRQRPREEQSATAVHNVLPAIKLVADGRTLDSGTGAGIQSSPISYELDGRQYIVNSSGGLLFAWALPETRIHTQRH